jgi:hypothetical protein
MFRLIACLFLAGIPARAADVYIGTFSFDVVIAGSQNVPGVNAFTISNYTGDPGAGGFALPPDFLVFTALTFQNVVVTLVSGGTPQVYHLTDIAGGPFSPSSLQFVDTVSFDYATIGFSLDQTSLTLSDSSVFAATPTVTATLLPSNGSFLQPGTDFVILAANSQAPEPATWPLSLFALLLPLIRLLAKSRLVAIKSAAISGSPFRAPARCAAVALLILAGSLPSNGQVTLSSTASPASGQAGITIVNVTGSNFPAGTITASATTVSLAPQPSGTATTTTVSTVTLITGSTRRVTFLIPGTINVSTPTVFRVSVTGTTGAGTHFNTVSGFTASLTMNPPPGISSLNPVGAGFGQTIPVTIAGAYTTFVQGATTVRFGPDVSVGGAAIGSYGPVTVKSPTSAIAQLTISPNANPGKVTVDVRTGTQQASLANAFSILPTPLVMSNDPDFTIVLFPDTQGEVTYNHPVWESMPDWVAANGVSQNIQAVIGEGDVVQNHTVPEFAEGALGWNVVDTAGIPYLVGIGNHDYDDGLYTNVPTGNRSATLFNTYFGVNRYSGKSWFGGSYNNSAENSWIKFDAGLQKLLVLTLEFFPRSEVLNWAQGVVTANPGRAVIVQTHGYLNNNGTRTLHTDPYGPDFYALNLDNDGQQMWDNFIKLNPNIFLVTSGHQICQPTSAYSEAHGNAGNLVHQLFVDHQCETNGGNGYMALLKFRPSLGRIDVTTYSAYLNAYDSTGVYTLQYDH